MSKVTVQKEPFCLPWTQTILGTHYKGTPNFMALDWLTRVNYMPALLGICVNKRSASHEAILETGEFSVNVPSEDMMKVTDYVGLVSARHASKADLFEVFYGKLKAAPMILSCPITMECRLTQQVDLPSNFFFIGEIVTVYSEERYLTDGKPDAKKVKPFLLTMPDNRYWSIGDSIGRAWSEGMEMRKRLKTGE